MKNFTKQAFTPSVQALQSKYGSRKAYERMETSGDRYQLGPTEISFIQSRDSFYLSTVGDNGWPYLQHRGGAPGFLRVLNETTIAMPDYSGNRQYISAGNLHDNEKACLFLTDYPSQQRLKIWAHAKVHFAENDPELAPPLEDPHYPARIERVFTFDIQGYDWNCPKHITPRFTKKQILNSPNLLKDLGLFSSSNPH